jgi:hypothetical protein
MKFLKSLKDNLNLFEGIESSNENEIVEFENKLGIKIPIALKEFLLLVGNDYDMILRGGGGAKQGIKNFDYILKVSFDLLKETNSIGLDNILPFLEYGDQFLFVYLDDGDNPPVYRFETELYYCGDDYIPNSSNWGYPKGVSKTADSFSEMIDKIVESKIKEV